MFNIHRMLFLDLKKVQMFECTPPQIPITQQPSSKTSHPSTEGISPYNFTLFGKPCRDILSFLYKPFRTYSISLQICWVSSRNFTSHGGWGRFYFMAFRLLENAFASQEIKFIYFSHAPRWNSPSGSYHHPLRQRKITHCPRQ